MKVVLKNLTKRFPSRNKKGAEVVAVNNFNFEIPDGQLIGLLGPSGCGKSTTLNLISGLETPTEGKIYFGDQDVTDLPPEERGVGLVFQNYALYPHLTVEENIIFPLQNLKGDRKMSKEAMHQKAVETAKLVQIDQLMERKPKELSGGQQQRVAIARALATNPKVLLCDEATSALDPKTTHSILDLIREINQTMGITVIVITHQMSVVQEICNRVAILENGTVVEEGEVSQIFSNPKAQATKALVFPDVAEGMDAYAEVNHQTVRLVFQGSEATAKPLITSMAIDCRIAANILAASTRTLNGKNYGNMLLSIPGGPDELATAVKYLSKAPNVTVQVDVEYKMPSETENAEPAAEVNAHE